MEFDDLPQGWSACSFAQTADRIKTSGIKVRASDYKEAGPIPVVDQGQKLVVGYTDREKFRFQGSLPVVIFGDHTKNVKYIDFDFAVGADGVVILKPKPFLHPKFFYYWLQSLNLHHLGYSRHFKLLAEETVAYPTSVEEQRRIVARVEALTCRLDQARQARQTALTEAERVMQAAVDSAFSKRSSGWETDMLEALCGKPQYGYTEAASAAPIGPRFLRITDIQDGRVNWETVPYCQCEELDKYRLQTGDILFARTGATTGKSYLVKDPPEAVFASYLIRVRRGQRILPEFLWWYFQSSNYWHAVFSGTEDGNRPNMNGSKLAGLEVPFPNSLETQKQIIKRLDAIRLKVSELQQLQSETEADLASFTPALLAKAFRGEL